MFCSVAKVPCNLSTTPPLVESVCVTSIFVEAPNPYTSLSCGKLFRPPRV